MFSTACILSCLSPLTLNWSQASLSLALLEVSYCFPSLCCQVLDRGSSDCCVFSLYYGKIFTLQYEASQRKPLLRFGAFVLTLYWMGVLNQNLSYTVTRYIISMRPFRWSSFFKDEQLWNRILCFLELHPCFSFSFWNRLTPSSLKGKHSELLKINTPVIPLTLVQQLWGNVGRSKSL